MRHLAVLFLLLILSAPARAGAGEPWQKWISQERFQQIVVEAAPKVGLFRAIWDVDAAAELYGGTSRDFCWFVRHQLSQARSAADADQIVAQLQGREIDAREFVPPESDVDVIGHPRLATDVFFDPAFVTRIEVIGREWFTPGNPRYQQELQQGGVPVEKIRLGREGFVASVDPALANGVEEIYRGVPTFLYRDTIRDTELFRQHGNHPLLLVLRWLRQVAVAYFQRHGRAAPEEPLLLALIDPDSAASAEKIVAAALQDRQKLQPFFDNADFVKRANRQLVKSYRSRVNPTAARRLHGMFLIDEVLTPYVPQAIKPYHTVMFARAWGPDQMGDGEGAIEPVAHYAEREGIAAAGATAVEFLHGTPHLDAYRSMIFAGAAPSEGGNAGVGLYVTDGRHRRFAENWRADLRPAGVPPLIVRLRLSPSARFVDTTQGRGKALWARFCVGEFGPVSGVESARYDAFAERFGIDALRFSYAGAAGYVVKNGAVIEALVGDTMPLMTYGEAAIALAERGHNVAFATALLATDPSLWAYAGELLREWPEEARTLIFARLVEIAPDTFFRRWNLLAPRYQALWGRPAVARLLESLDSEIANALRPPIGPPDAEYEKRVQAFTQFFVPTYALRILKMAGLVDANLPRPYRAVVVNAIAVAYEVFVKSAAQNIPEGFAFLEAMLEVKEPQQKWDPGLTRTRVQSLAWARSELRENSDFDFFRSGAPRFRSRLTQTIETLVQNGDAAAGAAELTRLQAEGQPCVAFAVDVLEYLTHEMHWSDSDWSWWTAAMAVVAPSIPADSAMHVPSTEKSAAAFPGFQLAREHLSPDIAATVLNAVSRANAVRREEVPSSRRLRRVPPATRFAALQGLLVNAALSRAEISAWVELLVPEPAFREPLAASAMTWWRYVVHLQGPVAGGTFLNRLVALTGVPAMRRAAEALVEDCRRTYHVAFLEAVGAMLRVPELADDKALLEVGHQQQYRRWHYEVWDNDSDRTGYSMGRARHIDTVAAERIVVALPESARAIRWRDVFDYTELGYRWMRNRLQKRSGTALAASEWAGVLRACGTPMSPAEQTAMRDLIRRDYFATVDHRSMSFLNGERVVEIFRHYTLEERRMLRAVIDSLPPGVERDHPYVAAISSALRTLAQVRKGLQHILDHCAGHIATAAAGAPP